MYYTESGEAIHYESAQHADSIKERVKLFVQSYGKSMDEDYLGMVLLRLEALCTYMKRKANEGDVNFKRMIDEGHLEHYEKDMQFIREHRAEWI
ncbi:trifolitoxin immunity domain protein [Bacillus cereus AH820]|uniref:Trifolitoxin immunity domain protein n=1 Tax=Bacillus cereus (strain AH820) TaxID=405535 RepID=B7JDT5_BACC0|nr:trifolitoxin immunity domain protein [Bacillus cereus AH820]